MKLNGCNNCIYKTCDVKQKPCCDCKIVFSADSADCSFTGWKGEQDDQDRKD